MKDIDKLIQDLKSDYSDVRRNAVESLGEIKDARAMEPLIAALKDEHWRVRDGAAEALGKIGWEPSNTAERITLLAVTKKWDELVKIGGPVVEPLISALNDEYSGVRYYAAGVLGKIKDSRAVQPLISALKDEERYVRMEAAEALGEIKDPRATQSLIAVLNDDDRDVQINAMGALAKIGTPAVEPLIAALKDEHLFVEINAAGALGKIKDIRAMEPLIAALKDENWQVRMETAGALGEIEDSRAVEPLIAALKDEDWHVRMEAAKALGKIKNTRAVQPLISALKKKDEYSDVLEGAMKALAKIGAPAVQPLIAVLKDEDSLVRWRVAGVLGEIGWEPSNVDEEIELFIASKKWDELVKIGASAVEALIAALNDKGSDVRKGAAEALGKIGWEPSSNTQPTVNGEALNEVCIAFYIFNADQISDEASDMYGSYAQGEILKALAIILKPMGGWDSLPFGQIYCCDGDLFENSTFGEIPAARVIREWFMAKTYSIDVTNLNLNFVEKLKSRDSIGYIPYAIGFDPIWKSQALKLHQRMIAENTIGYLGFMTLSEAPPLLMVAKDLNLQVKMEIKGSKCSGWLALDDDIREAGLEK